jgi:hypothetical protein
VGPFGFHSNMKSIESMHAAYEISALMMSAKKSVALFAPDGWQFFSYENYNPLLYDVAHRGVRARFVFSASTFPAGLDAAGLPPNGCEIRTQRETAGNISYVIIDRYQAIQGRYIPGEQSFYVALGVPGDASEIDALVGHFEGAWSEAGTVETLFPLSDTELSELIEVPRVAVHGWNAKLRMLADKPSDLYNLASRDFEELVAELLAREGFATTLTPTTCDGGRDVLASLILPTGPILCLVECKRYAKHRPVRIEHVRSLFGTVTSEGATNGLIVTTSSFTKPAKQFVHRHSYRLALKEHADLVAWLRKIVNN